MNMRRMASALVCCLVCLLTFTGCAGKQQPAAVSGGSSAATKTIVVGYESYPPLCYLNEDGDPAGIDMDIATEAFHRMGYRPIFKPINWLKKDKLLASGKIDCIWCCFSMDGREDSYTWAGPYLRSDEVVAVMPNSSITSLSDLTDKVVAVAATTEPARVLLNDLNPNVRDVKTVYSLQDYTLLYPALGKGYVDAIATHRAALKQYMEDYGTKFRILDDPLLSCNVGVAFAKDTTSSVPAKLDRVLKKMNREGAIKKIVARYVDDPDDYLVGAK